MTSLGLSTSNWGLCPTGYGSHTVCVPRILLFVLPACHHRKPPTWNWGGTASVPYVLRSFQDQRPCCSELFFTSTPACCKTLPWVNWPVQSAKWAMLLHYRVQAHQGHQRAVASFQQVQCTWPDVTHKPTPWQTCHRMYRLRTLRNAQRDVLTVGINVQCIRFVWIAWPFSDVLLTFFVIEQASPMHAIPDMTDPSGTDLEWKRQSVEGDNDTVYANQIIVLQV